MTDHATQRILTQLLAHKDTPCPRCGYNLRNLTTNRCPECGLELTLQVKGTQPFLRWWLVTLLANTIPIGFHLFLFAAVIINQFSSWASWDNEMLIPLIVTPLSLIIITALLWKRRLFLLLHLKFQRSLATASIILHPAALGFLFLFASN